MFPTASHVVVAGGVFNVNEPQSAMQVILQAFKENYVAIATHDNNDTLKAPKCHPGTRVAFRSRLSNWVKDMESTVYLTWLHGPAGAGKSAIARSLARSLHQDGFLAASFFFFKTDPRRNSEKPFIATLAYQISRSIPDTRPYIVKVVEDDPTLCSLSLETQFEKLITEPLVQSAALESKSLHPMLIIIDGLDECVGQEERNMILQIIINAHPRLHGRIKFLIASRPEHDIQRSFRSATSRLGQYINIVELQSDLRAYDDVRLYLRDNFQRIKQDHPLREHFPQTWPSEDAIERLVEKSSGYFIYASTVVKYIENDSGQPQNCLDIVLDLLTTSQKPFAALDALYLNILTSSRTSRTNHALLVNILSVVILNDQFDQKFFLNTGFMNSPLFIESALFLQRGEVQLALVDLMSLVGVDGTIEFRHKSFSDFLLDSSRSNEFHVDLAQVCTLIAKGCLRLLSDKPGSLERSWSDFIRGNPRLECHHLLSLCCERAVFDLDLQTAMMKYDFNLIPSCPDTSSQYFWVFCSCLRNYRQASIFTGTKVIKWLSDIFDNYLLSELRRWVPLDSELMKALHAAISPLSIDWKSYQAFIYNNNTLELCTLDSCFLHYMYNQWSSDGEVILCEFFYSKDRACEYYLG